VYFREQLGIPVSEGSTYNFNREAYGLLATFEEKVKTELAGSDLLHVDETGINPTFAIRGVYKPLSQKGNKNMSFNSLFQLVPDGTDGKLSLQILKCLFNAGQKQI
jgi:hypothetical protein